MSGEKAAVKLPMACCCGEERKSKLDALVNGRSATTMLYELTDEHGYQVDWIGVDQWCGLTVKSIFAGEDFDEDEIPKRFRNLPPIRIEFDVLEHGLAKLLEYLTPKPPVEDETSGQP